MTDCNLNEEKPQELSFPRGRIVKGIGGFYYAMDENQIIYTLRAKGKFRKQQMTPTVGDSILFSPGKGEESGWIEEILPRQNILIRPPVSNIQTILLTIAPQPEPDFFMLDTLLVMAEKEHISPAILINKADLDDTLFQKIQSEYRSLNIPILSVSASTGYGLDELRVLLKSGICCFAGQSGVGKSSLIAAATGILLESGEISQKIHRGRHTTRRVELLCKNGYQVLDTPGFSLLELWNNLDPAELQKYYPEFAEYEGQCRFAPCLHLKEPDCAVLEACAAGKISNERMERYHILLQKAQENWRKRYD